MRSPRHCHATKTYGMRAPGFLGWQFHAQRHAHGPNVGACNNAHVRPGVVIIIVCAHAPMCRHKLRNGAHAGSSNCAIARAWLAAAASTLPSDACAAVVQSVGLAFAGRVRWAPRWARNLSAPSLSELPWRAGPGRSSGPGRGPLHFEAECPTSCGVRQGAGPSPCPGGTSTSPNVPQPARTAGCLIRTQQGRQRT